MILVDSSVWIDYFQGKSKHETRVLDGLLGTEPIVIGDLILTEVLQGFRADKDFRTARRLLSAFPVHDMLGKQMALKSAENFRALRKRGVTIRKTADVIIASYCIENKIPLLFSDRDFRPFVDHLGLLSA